MALTPAADAQPGGALSTDGRLRPPGVIRVRALTQNLAAANSSRPRRQCEASVRLSGRQLKSWVCRAQEGHVSHALIRAKASSRDGALAHVLLELLLFSY